ncbi:PLAT/LH2 domain-containing protein [Rubritalea marina]|uniref:PLAT/LH2 domain-containing protein n=1 Tax=Rubritalea marina TaxID=361055 RepID=UPI0003A91EFD|nr:PLAT/LH2 domain-containing protein [Rubritalea marina]
MKLTTSAIAFALSLGLLSANETRLYVSIETGTKQNSSTDSRVYLSVNKEEKSYLLDIPGKNDREAGATDTYEAILLDIKPEDIEWISIRIEGDDAWYPERFHFHVKQGDNESEKLSIRNRKWMSSVKEKVRSKEVLKLRIKGKLKIED